MKRSLKVFSLLFMLMVLLTGCFKKDPKAEFNDAIKKMDDIKGITAKIDATIDMSAEGTTMSMGMGLNGDFYGEGDDASGHYTVNMNILGMSQEIEMYTIVKDGYTYNYTKTNDAWTYTKAKYDDETDEMDEEELLSCVKEVTEEDGLYTITLDKNKLNELMKKEELKDAVSESGIEEFKEDVAMTAKIDKGYITYLEIDLANLVKAVTGETNIEGTNVAGKIKITLSNINKVNKINVPEEVTKNAKEEDPSLDTDLLDM